MSPESRHVTVIRVVFKPMPASSQHPGTDYYTRAANDDDINGGARTRTKRLLNQGDLQYVNRVSLRT
jgi:hypothetical protein